MSTCTDVQEAGPDELRQLFRRHAAGVAVITTQHEGQPVGLLVNSLASVSTRPPTVSFNVSVSSSSWPALQAQPTIGLHILDDGQQEVAELFARKGADRFAAPTSWRTGPYGVPLLEGTVGWSVARIEQRVPVADHVIVVARLLHTGTDDAGSPLLHHDGAYHQVQASVRSASRDVR